jgi:hypothetical protein
MFLNQGQWPASSVRKGQQVRDFQRTEACEEAQKVAGNTRAASTHCGGFFLVVMVIVCGMRMFKVM